MFLIMILSIMVVMLTVATIGGISLLGSIGVIVFGDIIVCIGASSLVIYLLIRRKKRKR